MDFFEHQDRARKQTRRLLALFALAVVGVVVCTTVAVWGVLELTGAGVSASEHGEHAPDIASIGRDARVLGGVALSGRSAVLAQAEEVATHQSALEALMQAEAALPRELIDLGVKLDLVQKSGSWFSMGETRIGQGRDAAKKYLLENPEIAQQLEADIRKNFDKLMSNQARIAAKAAGRAVDVSADDFDDAD